jgi:SMI1 / KNR4 family (SUKH-1)
LRSALPCFINEKPPDLAPHHWLFLLASVLSAGVLARSPWIVLLLALTFTVAYILGRWPSWISAINTQTLAQIIAQISITFATQTVMVAVLYLIGRGCAAVFGRAGASTFSNWDIGYCAVVTVLGLTLGGIVTWRERGNPLAAVSAFAEIAVNDDVQPAWPQPDEIRLLPEPVTLQSFFSGIHYTHGRYEGPENTYNGTPNADSAGSDEKIAAAEARLGVTLPDGLRAIYRTQNGGSINALCVPKSTIETHRLFDDIVTPFSGYDDLLPCEGLRTLFASTTDFADPDDIEQSDMFPDGCKAFIVLAQWYRHTLFLDYSASDRPSVGFVDFDDTEWQANCVRWGSFEEFFAALRHYETV